MRLLLLKRVNPNWYISIRADEDHKANHWPRYIFPWLAFTPWHKSVLASFGGNVSMSMRVEAGWWIWRVSMAIGQSRKEEGSD